MGTYQSVADRFFSHVALAGECWEWQGFRPDGYGRFWLNGANVAPHRWAYEFFIDSIPEGLQLDHLCRNRGCVNPWHLDPVTPRVNTLRGETITAAAAAKTHCPSGHAYAGDNLRVTPTGRRVCRACHRVNAARSRARQEAA